MVPETASGDSGISITTADHNPNGETSDSGEPQILAAVGANLPKNIMYLLRLVLSMIAMLAGSMIIYTISQNAFRNEK
jgi:hypothetical protein